jgi:glycosyltransferase 2 family protein
MKLATILAAVAGLILGTIIIGYFGFGAVADALVAVGWGGFLAICAYHAVFVGILGLAWYAIVPSPRRDPGAYLWGRLIRDSGSEILPLSQIGGFLMGARAATLFGPSMILAFATTVVDVTVEVLAQLGYTVLGLALLTQLQPDARLIYPVTVGVALGLVGILLFVLVQRRGTALMEKLSERLAASWLPQAAAKTRPLQEALDHIYAQRGGLAVGFLLHLGAWVASAAEAWLALHFMGVDLGIAAVIAIESLLYAIRSVAFAVPNAVGVQEGAYVMLGAMFGLPPEMALAVSLLKRGRDLVLGVPALLIWQAIEGGTLFRRREATRISLDNDAGSSP